MYEHPDLYDASNAHKAYAEESAALVRFLDCVHPDARTLLDVGCGTGRHLEFLRDRFESAGLDLSERLLAIAADRCPGVPLHLGDMRGFSLGRTYDIVTCLFASIGYVTTLEGVRSAVSSMARHLAPGGILFIEPWLTPSAFIDGRFVHNVYRFADRTISRMYVQRRQGQVSVFDMHFLVGSVDSGVDSFIEREEMWLYSHEEYLAACHDAGLNVIHGTRGLHGYGVYAGRKGRPWTAAESMALAAMR